jgi:hypothetical protein
MNNQTLVNKLNFTITKYLKKKNEIIIENIFSRFFMLKICRFFHQG